MFDRVDFIDVECLTCGTIWAVDELIKAQPPTDPATAVPW